MALSENSSFEVLDREGSCSEPSGEVFGRSRQSSPVTLKPVKELSQEARLVLGCFRQAGTVQTKALYYDDFAMRLDMAPQYLWAALTELSLAGYLDMTVDQRYVCPVDLEKVWSL